MISSPKKPIENYFFQAQVTILRRWLATLATYLLHLRWLTRPKHVVMLVDMGHPRRGWAQAGVSYCTIRALGRDDNPGWFSWLVCHQKIQIWDDKNPFYLNCLYKWEKAEN